MKYAIVEKENHHAIHAICDTLGGADRYIKETIPDNCARKIYMDKTLQPSDFEIVEWTPKNWNRKHKKRV